MVLEIISQFILEQYVKYISLSTTKVNAQIGAKFYSFLRKSILKFRDPIITAKIGQNYLKVNLSHQLPIHMAANPHYDTALPRICLFIKDNLGHLTMIDVGANIGDTVSLVSQKVEGRFLCIEANETFFELLKENVRNINIVEDIICLHLLCDENEGEGNASLISSHGSAHVSDDNLDSNKVFLKRKKIDDIINEYPNFKNCNIMKIDTDGYDYRVIRGSETLLKEMHPLIFFELSPEYLMKIGEDPMSIFDYLYKHGYREALFYDNFGVPILKISVTDKAYIGQLINYINKKGLYFDLLLFHDSMKEAFDLFVTKEREIF